MYQYFYEHGYAGAWGWQLKDGSGHCQDDKEDIFNGVLHISQRSDFGKIDIDLNPVTPTTTSTTTTTTTAATTG